MAQDDRRHRVLFLPSVTKNIRQVKWSLNDLRGHHLDICDKKDRFRYSMDTQPAIVLCLFFENIQFLLNYIYHIIRHYI